MHRLRYRVAALALLGGLLAAPPASAGAASSRAASGSPADGPAPASPPGRPAGERAGFDPYPPLLPGMRVQLPPALHFFQFPLEPVVRRPGGRVHPSLGIAYSSLFQRELAAGGRSRFEADFELLTVTPRLAWWAADRLELSVGLPLFLPGSGFLDRPIEDYHRALGLPNGGREGAPRDDFASGLVVDGRLVYDGEPRFGVGDLAFLQSWWLAGGDGRPFGVALRTGVELPTGDAERGYGSGEVDVGAALAASVRRGGWALHGQASWLLPGDLAGVSRVETHAAYGFGVAVEASIVRGRLSAVVQLDGRTPFASGTGLDALDAPLLGLTVGGALRIGSVWLALGVAEDLRSGAAPDVTFLLQVSPRLD